MIYVPTYNNSNCVAIRDKDTIRVYDSRPTNNSNVFYTDYFINSHYLFVNGYQQFTQYSTLPTCINTDLLTSSPYYRNDFDNILVIFIILLIICFYFPYRILSRMFGRWFKW